MLVSTSISWQLSYIIHNVMGNPELYDPGLTNGRQTADKRPINGRLMADKRPINGRQMAYKRPTNGRQTASCFWNN